MKAGCGLSEDPSFRALEQASGKEEEKKRYMTEMRK
jgi:hypothetical protein